MTGVEPETEELRGLVLQIIGAYGSGLSFDSRESVPESAPPKPVPVPDGGYIGDPVPRRV